MNNSDFQPKKLIILAGGKGTRLSELTKNIPKPAINVNGRPLISYLCDWAFSSGMKTVIIAVGYKQAVIKRCLIDYFQLSGDIIINSSGVLYNQGSFFNGCQIIIRDTGSETDTAERLYAVRDLISDDDTFMVTYGDTLTDLDATTLLKSASTNNKTITMCIGRPDGRYGEIIADKGIVLEFKEKKRPLFYVNRGFFVIKRSIFDNWKMNYTSFEHQVLPDFVDQHDLGTHQDDCWFHSVDSVKDLFDLEEYLSANKHLRNIYKP